MKNNILFTLSLLAFFGTCETNLVSVDTVPTLKMYSDVTKAPQTNNPVEPTKKYVYEPDPARNSTAYSTPTKNETIEKVQDMYRNLSAREKTNFNKAYKQLQDICQTIIRNHEVSFSQNLNSTTRNLGPVQRQR